MLDFDKGVERDRKAERIKGIYDNPHRTPAELAEMDQLLVDLTGDSQWLHDDWARLRELSKLQAEVARPLADRDAAWHRAYHAQQAQAADRPKRTPEEQAALDAIHAERAEIGLRFKTMLHPDAIAACNRAGFRGALLYTRMRMVHVDIGEDGQATVRYDVMYGKLLSHRLVVAESGTYGPAFTLCGDSPEDGCVRHHMITLASREWDTIDAYVAYCERRAKKGLTSEDVREELAAYRYIHGDDAVRSILTGVGVKAVSDIRKQHYDAIADALEATR